MFGRVVVLMFGCITSVRPAVIGGSPEVKQVVLCDGTTFTGQLCPFESISAITRAYVGKRPDGSECVSHPGGCTLDMNTETYPDTYNVVMQKCNGSSACATYISEHSVALTQCGPDAFSNYLMIVYTCASPKSGHVSGFNSIKVCRSKYLDRPLCMAGSYAEITNVYVAYRFRGCGVLSHRDCIYQATSSTMDSVKNKCDKRSACRHFILTSTSIWCDGNNRFASEMHIQYICMPRQSDVQSTSVTAGHYANRPFCGVGDVLSILDMYMYALIPLGDDSVKVPFRLAHCVYALSDADIWWFKSECDGFVSCGRVIAPRYPELYCYSSITRAKYVTIIYICEPGFPAIQWMELLPRQHINVTCPAGEVIDIRGAYHVVRRGDGPRDRLISANDCVNVGDDYTTYKEKCDGHETCHSLPVADKYIYCSTKRILAESFYLSYSCRAMGQEVQKARYCSGDIIDFECPEQHLIHIDDIMFGGFRDLDNNTEGRRCSQLIDDTSGTYGRYHCEVDGKLYVLTGYNRVKSSCEGKRSCDKGLLAVKGPQSGSCSYGGGQQKMDSPPDYTLVEYLCYKEPETTTVMTQTTTSTMVALNPNKSGLAVTETMPVPVNLIYTVVPAVGGLVIITLVVVAVFLTRRNQSQTRNGDESVNDVVNLNEQVDPPNMPMATMTTPGPAGVATEDV